MIEKQVSPDNPIVFVLDPGNTSIEVPEYIDGQLIAESPSCVSIGVQPNFEGDTTIQLVTDRQHFDSCGMTKIYSGRVEAPTKRLAVVLSDFELVLSTETPSDLQKFEVWVDDEMSPARVALKTID